MTFTTSTAEMFSRYRYRENYDDMEIVSQSQSESDYDSESDCRSYNNNNHNNHNNEHNVSQHPGLRQTSDSDADDDVDDDAAYSESDLEGGNNIKNNIKDTTLNQYHPVSDLETGNNHNKLVLHLREICEDGSCDWSLFIRYEQNDVYLVYGVRKSIQFYLSNSHYHDIRLKFLGRDSLIAFFKHAFCSVSSKLNVTMYNMEFNDNTYEGTYKHYLSRMLSYKYDELFGYDGLDINMNTINDYLTILRYSWN
jgi:hypothetical protein